MTEKELTDEQKFDLIARLIDPVEATLTNAEMFKRPIGNRTVRKLIEQIRYVVIKDYKSRYTQYRNPIHAEARRLQDLEESKNE